MTQRTVSLLAIGALLASCLATQAAEPNLIQTTYPVADLVLPVEYRNSPESFNLVEPSVSMTLATTSPSPKPATLEAPLMKLIATCVAPDSWAEVGGKGTIDYFPLGMALVVSQTAEVHEQIAALLESLRKNADKEIGVEVRVVSISEEMARQLKEDGVIDCYNCGKNKDGSQEPQVSYMIDPVLGIFLERLQDNKSTEIVQHPRMTLANGQAATCQVMDPSYVVKSGFIYDGEEEQISSYYQHMPIPGWNVAVQPLVSRDQTSVQVHLGLTFTLASFSVPLFPITTFVTPVFEGGAQGQPIPMTYFIQQPTLTTINLKETLKIPTNSTAVLSGWKYEQESRWEGPPVLSQIPYVKDLFRHFTTKREPRYMLVLVTPRLVENTEKQETTQAPKAKPQLTGQVIAPGSAPAWTASWPQQLPPNLGDGMWGWGPTPQPVQPVKCEAPAPKPETDFIGEVRKEMAALLVRKYHQACEKGLSTEAKCIADEALELDPACFNKARTSELECK